MRKSWILLLSVTILFTSQYTLADTIVGGNITEDTTWTLAGSPYIVTQNLSVYSKLVVEPGVIVKFNKGTKIIVGSELIAIGNSDESIHFLSNETIPAVGDWGGIQFIDSAIDASLDIYNAYIGGCIIKHCKIEHASTAISCDENVSVLIDSNRIMNNGRGIYSKTGDTSGVDGSPIIINNIISNNTPNGGIYIENGTPIIRNNTIKQNSSEVGGGILSAQSDSINFENNFGTTHILNNIIIENSANDRGGAIYLGGSVYTKNNIITDNISLSNFGGGIHVSTGDFSNLTHITHIIESNDIYNNNGYEFYKASEGDCTAINNYWGTTETSVIDEKIYDYFDNIELGRVYYQPIATEPNKIVDFTASPLFGTSPLNVTFTNNSIGVIKTVLWDFGDNETSTEENPAHTFDNAGIYTVSLSVSGPDGSDSEIKSGYITVSEPGNGNGDGDGGGGGGGCFICSTTCE